MKCGGSYQELQSSSDPSQLSPLEAKELVLCNSMQPNHWYLGKGSSLGREFIPGEGCNCGPSLWAAMGVNFLVLEGI